MQKILMYLQITTTTGLPRRFASSDFAKASTDTRNDEQRKTIRSKKLFKLKKNYCRDLVAPYENHGNISIAKRRYSLFHDSKLKPRPLLLIRTK